MDNDDDDLPKEEPSAGQPAWIMTFADLMSLLMCFFVLLLSFSEIDAQKFKRLAGELSKAFGVQREMQANDIPMGTSPVFDQFSPGRPDPTVEEAMRQQTSEVRPELAAQTDNAQTESDAQDIRQAFASEIQAGQIQMETAPKRIILRIEEEGSFPSGSADLTYRLVDMLDEMREVLADVPGTITVEGHTDNIPIRTQRYRSNWDLSAARAASVVGELARDGLIEPQRLKVVGFADTHPRVDNDTPDQRAMNRRIEIVINQDESVSSDAAMQPLEQLAPQYDSLQIEQPGPTATPQ
ncbi:flagellar motor protein MotB [Terasakiispira papahanaumokuakeensis]|uniref:Flagellar motor protein MotB n=1 Tax=Terasakiispira papahanaumokuakeensis TaxID=197479 RepID=A0A1E2VD70_9GAMM|nr:flagellar motor protein MotB [Terasakiispira papahanaumokuakeensis]ODC04958.1 flagellar motor protein MotB [Terasakiispira papahanaumokuakeensis]